MLYFVAMSTWRTWAAVLCLVTGGAWEGYGQARPPTTQNPSPMQENIRAHRRPGAVAPSGPEIALTGLLANPIRVYMPRQALRSQHPDLLIHFMGDPRIVMRAADACPGRVVAVTVNLGSGSSVFEAPFSDSTLLKRLVDTVAQIMEDRSGHPLRFRRVMVSAFSAGYGAVRAILRQETYRQMIDAVLLLDGLHASYVPEHRPLAEGAVIDSMAYIPFLRFAAEAAAGEHHKRFLFTHSEIFPGTFVSTTESAAYLLSMLGIQAKPVLRWGPLGMQQISEARRRQFCVMGFAGNSAPDHVDHLQALPFFLKRMMR